MKNSEYHRDALRKQVRHWAEPIGVSVKQIQIRPMRNKWASCSTTGRVSLATDVLALSRRLQNYIIVHELLRLRVHNHGKLWKSLLQAYVGDYEKIEQSLPVLKGVRKR